MIVDSHAHIFDMKKGYSIEYGIIPVVVGYSHSSNRKAAETARKNGYPFALGIAPQTALREGVSKIDEWVSFIREARPNAIGEAGLDYKWALTRDDVEKEMLVFKRMIALAREMSLPLVIHSRNNPLENEVPKDAVEEILKMTAGMPLVMHFFSGTAEQAEGIAAQGDYISVTHMRSKERRKVINIVPLDRLMVETDSPFVGRSPEAVKDAIAYVAEVKGLGFDAVAEATARNARKFFRF
jgi:TatD DNase family protein